jgi:hypothetical protein
MITGDKKDTDTCCPNLVCRPAELGGQDSALPTVQPAPSAVRCTASICTSRPQSLGLTAWLASLIIRAAVQIRNCVKTHLRNGQS